MTRKKFITTQICSGNDQYEQGGGVQLWECSYPTGTNWTERVNDVCICIVFSLGCCMWDCQLGIQIEW